MGVVIGVAFWGGIIWWFTSGRKSDAARANLGRIKNASIHLVGGWYALGGIGLLILSLQSTNAPWYGVPLALGLAAYGLAVLFGFTTSVWLHPLALVLPLFAFALISAPR